MRHLSVAPWAALLLAAPGTVRAQYRAEQFSTANGLPQSTVSGIAQTRDGYLWFSTYDGLARFDGVTFTIFDRGTTPVMRHTLFMHLTLDANGALWAGAPNGVLRYRDGEFTWVEPVKSAAGAARPGDEWLQPAFAPPSLRHWRVIDGAIARTEAGGTRIPLPRGITPELVARHAREDGRGRLWIPAPPGGGVWCVAGARLRRYSRANGVADTVDDVRGEDRDGNLWLVSPSGLTRVRGDSLTWIDGFALVGSRQIRASFVDRDGTLWLGTNERGAFRISRQFLRSYSQEDGLGGRNVYPLLQDRGGRVWIGAGNALTSFAHGRFNARFLVPGASGALRLVPWTPDPDTRRRSRIVHCLFEDREGHLWVCAGESLLRFDDGRLAGSRTFGADGATDAAFEDSHGDLWVSTGHTRLIRIHGDSIRRFGAADGLNPAAAVTVIHETADGVLLVGTRRGLVRREGERFAPLTTQFSLDVDQIRCLYTDDDDALWIGTFNNGLVRMKHGRFAHITSRDGLASNGAFWILPDSQGHFWITGDRGIYRVSRRQLDDFADGRAAAVRSVSYGAADGMRSVEANGGRSPAGWKAADGTLWFPTQDGVVVIDPAAAASAVDAPRAVVSSVSVDGSEQTTAGRVRLEPGQSDLDIAYTAPTSVQAGDIRFRYRLSGADDRWIDAGTRRRVHYAHLPPGHYAFQLSTASGDGPFGGVGASLEIEIAPHLWQTVWFAWSLGLAMLTLAAGGYTMRVRGLQARERALRVMVDARTADLRVANERLQQLAVEDPLTGLANRRRFDEFLEREWQRSHRTRSPLAVLMLDVDSFKRYNDTYGHQAGDRCLQGVAGVLRDTIQRTTDLAARYGGEEFAVVLVDTSEAAARAIAESVRARVESLAIPHAASTAAGVVTVSVGVADTVAGGHSAPSDVVAAADRALYRAKDGGRNRVA